MTIINSKLKNLSLVHLILNSVAIILICAGLTGNDIFLNTANYGPLMIIGLGLFIQTCSLEVHHLISKGIDSWIFSRIDVTEKETRWFSNVLITSIIVLFATFLASLSLYSVSEKNTTVFAMLLLGVSVSLGIAVGRVINSNKGGEYSNESSHRNAEKKQQHNDLTKFLTDEGNFSKMHKDRLDEQTQLISKEMMRLITDDYNQFFVSLNEVFSVNNEGSSPSNQSRHSQQIMHQILSKYFSNTAILQAWARYSLKLYHVNNNPESNKCYSILASYIMFNPLKILTKHMYSVNPMYDSKNYILADRILRLLGDVASEIDNENLFSSGSNSHRITIDHNSEVHLEYIQTFLHDIGNRSIKCQIGNRVSWSPWWLLNIRTRFFILYNQHDSDVWAKKNMEVKKYSNIIHEIWCDKTLNAICHLLNGADIFPDDSMSISEKISGSFSQLNKGQKIPTNFLNNLINSIHDAGGESTDSLIKIAWILSRSIYQSKNK